jgi:hypothetical protein
MTKPIHAPIRHIYDIAVHKNGKGRKRKIMAHTDQGMFSARRAYYSLYHPDWDMKGKVIHLDNDDLNFHPNNLICVTDRVANNLVHFNNHYISPSPTLTRDVIKLIEAQIKFKEVTKNDD